MKVIEEEQEVVKKLKNRKKGMERDLGNGRRVLGEVENELSEKRAELKKTLSSLQIHKEDLLKTTEKLQKTRKSSEAARETHAKLVESFKVSIGHIYDTGTSFVTFSALLVT